MSNCGSKRRASIGLTLAIETQSISMIKLLTNVDINPSLPYALMRILGVMILKHLQLQHPPFLLIFLQMRIPTECIPYLGLLSRYRGQPRRLRNNKEEADNPELISTLTTITAVVKERSYTNDFYLWMLRSAELNMRSQVDQAKLKEMY
ncbi:hypothetical protein V6N13_140216 [Hibiscus sabdariffa]